MENPPAGNHIARCIGLVDMGTQAHSWNNETWSSRDVRIVWELPFCQMAGKYKPELKGTIFRVSWTGKQSLHPQAKLRKFVDSWKGKKMTKEEVDAFDPRAMLGKACRLTLIEGETYVNVEGVSPLGAGDKCPKQHHPTVFFSLEEQDFDQKVYASLSENLKKKIAASPEFKALVGGGEDGGDPPSEYSGIDPTDDVPF